MTGNDNSPTRHGPSTGTRRARNSRRRTLWAATAVILAVVTAVSGYTLIRDDTGKGAHGATARPEKTATVTVRRMDLSDTRTLLGSLGYGRARTVRGAGDGTVTWLPRAGAVVARGETLFRKDDRPVPLFYGSTPLFRPLARIGTVGRDVRTVADNLRAMGYDIGVQPGTGSLVRLRQEPAPEPPAASPDATGGGAPSTGVSPAPSVPATSEKVESGDGVWTDSLAAAVERWQDDAGLPRTGELNPGDVVVLPGKVRVAALAASTGDTSEAELMSVSGTTKTVDVPVDGGDIGEIRKGARVTVSLPNGETTDGTVSAVSRTFQQSGDEAPVKVTVSVALTAPAAVKDIEASPVQVGFTSRTERDVLTVPAEALLALQGDGYALQRPDGGLVPVQVGMFARGRAQVSGKGLADGMTVVTAS